MNKTPAPIHCDCERAGVAVNDAHAAAVTNDAGDARVTHLRRESMGTAQGSGCESATHNPRDLGQGSLPSTIISELNRAKVAFQQRAIVACIAPPFITENGKVSPLVPVAIIDRESDAGSYADALAHSVHITQSDYNQQKD